MRPHSLFVFPALFCGQALSQSLQSVLLDNGFTKFAAMLEGNAVLTSGDGLLIYAPTDAALGKNGGAALARREGEDNLSYYINEIGSTFSLPTGATGTTSAIPSSTAGPRRMLARNLGVAPLPPCGIVRQSWLSDPAKVNLGPGRNQTIVEKKVCAASGPLVFTGLGASVKVTADDIPFDRGFIRPISGVFTLPRPVSETLPFLSASKFLQALDQAGILSEVDSRAAITVLAPNDAAFRRDTANMSTSQIASVLRNHIIVSTTAYTPLIQSGMVFATLSGGSVTASIVDDVVSFGGARVAAADAIIKNGVIHTINKVLTAHSLTAKPTPTVGPVATGAAAVAEPPVWRSSMTFVAIMAAARLFLG